MSTKNKTMQKVLALVLSIAILAVPVSTLGSQLIEKLTGNVGQFYVDAEGGADVQPLPDGGYNVEYTADDAALSSYGTTKSDSVGDNGIDYGIDPLYSGKNDHAVGDDGKEEVVDSEGRLLVPFDLAYPEAFEALDDGYCTDHVLVKMQKGFSGNVTSALNACGVASLEAMFNAGKGEWWYKAMLKDGADIAKAIASLRALDEVIIADYDYTYEAEAFGDGVTPIEIEHFNGKVWENPYLTYQWNLDACNVQQAWQFLDTHGSQAGGSSSVVVAVIDTGVDYTHPDLASSMWINRGEIPDNGIDDDGNGYIDDVYGANMTAETGDPMDDHGHGTHVAGIIGAANNKIGIVGVAYNCKIMAVKAGQATGLFNQSDIAEAIIYAYENGADVINMSFGGAAISIATQDALETAYTTVTLVAAAANESLPNEQSKYDDPTPYYPAALSYVIGVMSINQYGFESGFTNWDVYKYNSSEYEVYAPGEQILSTLPGNRYAFFSGTSMAAPFVSGVAALLRSYFTDRDMYTSRYIAAQICATSEVVPYCCEPDKHLKPDGNPHDMPMIVDSFAALAKLPKPEVSLYNYYLFDNSELSAANNGDGVIDTGETIDVGLVLRNYWGMSKDTVITAAAVSENGVVSPYISFVTDSVDFGGIGTYSSKDNLIRGGNNVIEGVGDTIRFVVSKDCPNDYQLQIIFNITCHNALDESDHTLYGYNPGYGYIWRYRIVFTVRNGVILPAQIYEDMTLTKDNYYIIPDITTIADGVTVTVDPGTKIQFWSDDPRDPYADKYIARLVVEGNLVCRGTEEEMIQFFPSTRYWDYLVVIEDKYFAGVTLEYTSIINPAISAIYADHCLFARCADPSKHYYLGYRTRDFSGGGDGITTNYIAQTNANCRLCTNSVFYYIGDIHARKGYPYIEDTALGERQRYISCLFYETYYQYNALLRDCVIMGGRSVTDVSSLYSSINKLEQNSETGVYTLSWGSNSYYDDYWDIFTFEGRTVIPFFIEKMMDEIGATIIGAKDGTRELAFTLDNNCNRISTPIPSVDIDVESEYRIIPLVTPISYDVDDLIYVSEDESIATVSSDGIVAPVREGSTDIYIYSRDYVTSAKITICVTKNKVPVEDVSVPDDIYLIKGDNYQLMPEVLPKNATERFVSFSSSNNEIVSVSDTGIIKCNAFGNAVITVECSGKTADVTVHVVKAAESVSFKKSIVFTYIGDTDASWKPSVIPVEAASNIVYYSSDPGVAYVDSTGSLVRASVGNARIKAIDLCSGLSASFDVIVAENSASANYRIIQAEYNNGGTIYVCDDNCVYYNGGDAEYRYPTKIGAGFISATKFGDSVYAVTTDGVLNYYKLVDGTLVEDEGGKYGLHNISGVKKVTGDESSLYYLKNDGTVWSIGYNGYGRLGDGTTIYRDTPVRALVSNIVDISFGGNAIAMLDKYGDMWISGYKYDSTPVVLASLVEELLGWNNYYGYCFVKMQGGVYKYYYGQKVTSLGALEGNGGAYMIACGGYTQEPTGPWADFGARYGLYAEVDSIIYTYNSKIVQLADGTILASGDNSNYQLGDGTNQNSTYYSTGYDFAQVRFGMGDYCNNSLQCEEVNIDEKLRLKDERLVLKFNQALEVGSNLGYVSIKDSKGNEVSAYRNIDFNTLTVTPAGSLDYCEEYTITIPSGTLQNTSGFANEEIVFTFTYVSDMPLELKVTNMRSGAGMPKSFSATFEFDTVIRRGDAFDSIIITNSNNEAVDGVDIGIGGNTLTVSKELDYGDYTVVIPAGAIYSDTGAENAEMVYDFSVNRKVSLLSNSHPDGRERAGEGEDIVLTYQFAQAGDKFGDISLVSDSGEPVDVTASLVDGVLTISHAALLQGEGYTLTVPAGAVVDALGGTVETVSRFTVYAPSQLRYASIVDGETNVALDASLKFYFDHIESVDASKITLLCGEEAVAFNAVAEGDVLVITPSGLEQGKKYNAIIGTGAVVDEKGHVNAVLNFVFNTIRTVENEQLSEATFINLLQSYLNAGLVSNIQNCAIFNNFNKTDPEFWVRFAIRSQGKYGMSGNYYGTTDTSVIEHMFLDCGENYSEGDIVVSEDYITAPPEKTFPFVTSIKLYNVKGEEVFVVSNETVKFVVEFNRDMDVTDPLRVRFGSSDPYAEYEIPGDYVSPRRWEGTYTLKTTIENGNQFFNITGGRAASDHFLKLYELKGRLGFEINTALAQSLIMQGIATDNGVQLTWEQDDFDTLAGYNVYRSDAEDGFYQRLNSSVLAPDEKAFFDDTVEPGKVYYYNFTVVQTDLAESTPSGKIVIMSKDTMAPNVYHTPVRTAYTGSNLVVAASVVDNYMIAYVRLYYRTVGESEWRSTAMSALNGRYTGIIPAEYISLDGLEYYIDAFDGVSHTYKGTAEAPLTVTVKVAIDANSLGDVDGDGVITSKDALMLLKAANDLLNLTEEQFLRADINGDKILSAAEGMRILDYVTGRVTTIV